MSNGTGSTENGPSSPMERLAARRAAMPPVVQDYAKQLATTIDYRVRLRQLRRTLGLTQATAARIAGVDQADISKIENGGINPSVDRMNRIMVRLGEYAEQRPPAATATPQRPMTTAARAAVYLRAIRHDEDAFTNLKLQKLLYYAQGFALVLRGRPLFPEAVKAWELGPVVPQVWKEYTGFGKDKLPRPEGFQPASLPQDARAILEQVYIEYGRFESWALAEMTHAEAPWRETPKDAEISLVKLAEYFASIGLR